MSAPNLSQPQPFRAKGKKLAIPSSPSRLWSISPELIDGKISRGVCKCFRLPSGSSSSSLVCAEQHGIRCQLTRLKYQTGRQVKVQALLLYLQTIRRH
jgi:hypothetical protein